MRVFIIALLAAISYAQTEVLEISEDETIRIVEDNEPQIFYKGHWLPICGYSFDYNGATNFCRRLGYMYGHITSLHKSYGQDSLQIGQCAQGQPLTQCTWGDNTYEIGGKHCSKTAKAAISIKCKVQRLYNGPFEEYKRYHDTMTHRYLDTGFLDFKIMTFVCRAGVWDGKPNRGLSDHTGALLGLLLFSMMEQIVFYVDCPFLRDVWTQPNIQWYQNLTHIHHNHVDIDWVEYHVKEKGELIDIDALYKRVKQHNITTIRSNRGLILKLWDRGIEIRRFFSRFGLTLDNAFQMLHDFLFQPTEEVLDIVSTFPKPRSTRKMVLLQMRTGDACMTKNPECRERARKYSRTFVKCAMALEKRIQDKMAWYIMSDNVHVKRHIMETYRRQRQIIMPMFSVTNNSVEYTRDNFVVNLVAEITFGRQSDYFIVSNHSGIGRQVAFRSGREMGHTYYGDMEICRPWPLRKLMTDYAWI